MEKKLFENARQRHRFISRLISDVDTNLIGFCYIGLVEPDVGEFPRLVIESILVIGKKGFEETL
jgi:hypothetical protein